MQFSANAIQNSAASVLLSGFKFFTPSDFSKNMKTCYTGIDLESVQRFSRLLAERPKLLRRLFFEGEWAHAHARRQSAQTLAGIWCAKEAVVKALYEQVPLLPTEVEVLHTQVGRPYVRLHGNGQKILGELDVSIAHTRDVAVAHAVYLVDFNE